MSSDLESFIHGLYSSEEQHKLASQELGQLSIAELEEVLGLRRDLVFEKAASTITTKHAYVESQDRFLEEFAGTPLHQEAIALCEKMLQIDAEDLKRRQMRESQSDIYEAKEQVRLEKAMLRLKLHKMRAAGAVLLSDDDGAEEDGEGLAKSSSVAWRKLSSMDQPEVQSTGNVQYIGDIGSGSPTPPSWPRAAMGVDSAGRQATPEESSKKQKVYPQTQVPGGTTAQELAHGYARRLAEALGQPGLVRAGNSKG